MSYPGFTLPGMTDEHDHEYCLGPNGSIAPDCPDFDPERSDEIETDHNTDPYAIGSRNPFTMENLHR